jgi:hypothetical protein
MVYNIICLTETWLNDLCYSHNLSPDSYTVFCSDRVSANKTRGGGGGGQVLIALFFRACSCKCRMILQQMCMGLNFHFVQSSFF